MSFLFYAVYGNCLSYADKYYKSSSENTENNYRLMIWVALPSFFVLEKSNSEKIFLKYYIDKLIDEKNQNVYLDLMDITKIRFENPISNSKQYCHDQEDEPGLILTQIVYYLNDDTRNIIQNSRHNVMKMPGLDQSAHSLKQILEDKKAEPSVRSLVGKFHQRLTRKLDDLNLDWEARTNRNGITYLCTPRKKAFIWLNVNKGFLSLYFFSGHGKIEGLPKANWQVSNDRIGSKKYPITDRKSLEKALKFAVEANELAKNWAMGVEKG